MAAECEAQPNFTTEVLPRIAARRLTDTLRGVAVVVRIGERELVHVLAREPRKTSITGTRDQWCARSLCVLVSRLCVSRSFVHPLLIFVRFFP